jgi:hypothetical protein
MATSLLLARGGSAGAFFRGLSEGDPVAWVILGCVVVFSGIAFFQKCRGWHVGS